MREVETDSPTETERVLGSNTSCIGKRQKERERVCEREREGGRG